MTPKKYAWLYHLHEHHCCKPEGFEHRLEDAIEMIEEHPELSKKLKNLMEKLCRDLENLFEELDS